MYLYKTVVKFVLLCAACSGAENYDQEAKVTSDALCFYLYIFLRFIYVLYKSIL